jgi:hypothetical protein
MRSVCASRLGSAVTRKIVSLRGCLPKYTRAMDLRAHGPVEDQDAFAQRVEKGAHASDCSDP